LQNVDTSLPVFRCVADGRVDGLPSVGRPRQDGGGAAVTAAASEADRDCGWRAVDALDAEDKQRLPRQVHHALGGLP
jgi:hypothetical protein